MAAEEKEEEDGKSEQQQPVKLRYGSFSFFGWLLLVSFSEFVASFAVSFLNISEFILRSDAHHA